MCVQRCRTMSPLSTMSSVLSRQSRCAPTRHVGARLMIAWARFVSDARGGRELIFGERGGGYVQSVVDRRDVESQVHFTVFPLSPWWGVSDESIQAGTRHGVLGTNAAGRVCVDACWSRSTHADGSKRRGDASFRVQRCRKIPPLSTMSLMSSGRNRCAPARRGGARLMKAYRHTRARCASDERGSEFGLMRVGHAAHTPTAQFWLMRVGHAAHTPTVQSRRCRTKPPPSTLSLMSSVGAEPLRARSPWWRAPDVSIQAGTVTVCLRRTRGAGADLQRAQGAWCSGPCTLHSFTPTSSNGSSPLHSKRRDILFTLCPSKLPRAPARLKLSVQRDGARRGGMLLIHKPRQAIGKAALAKQRGGGVMWVITQHPDGQSGVGVKAQRRGYLHRANQSHAHAAVYRRADLAHTHADRALIKAKPCSSAPPDFFFFLKS